MNSKKPFPPKGRITLGETKAIDETKLIVECLRHNQGLVIGEIHEDKSPKQFLIDNISFLVSQGVTTLYMEHLLHEHQDLLDKYVLSSRDAPLSSRLASYLKLLDRQHELTEPGTFTNVVKAAKQKGIRIIAIDSEATYSITARHIGDILDESITINRCKIMNMAMLERFKQYHNGEKYVVFTGCAHASRYKGVAGISDILGCRNIIVRDLRENQIARIEQNLHQQETSEKTTVEHDFIFHRSPTANKLTIPLIGASSSSSSPVTVDTTAIATPPRKNLSYIIWHDVIKNVEDPAAYDAILKAFHNIPHVKKDADGTRDEERATESLRYHLLDNNAPLTSLLAKQSIFNSGESVNALKYVIKEFSRNGKTRGF